MPILLRSLKTQTKGLPEEMAQSAKHCPHKHEGMNSDPQPPREKLGEAVHNCHSTCMYTNVHMGPLQKYKDTSKHT